MCNFEGRNYNYFDDHITKNRAEFNGYEDLEKYPDTPAHRKQFPELYNFTFYHFLCYIRRMDTGEFCGYVKVDKFWKDNFEDINVHGGITYDNEKEGVIGFDTCHCYDKSPFSVSPEGKGGRYYKNRDYVMNQLKNMCKQLLLLLPKWSPDTHQQFPSSLRKYIWDTYKIWYLRKQSQNFSKILEKDIWINIINLSLDLIKSE